MSPNTEDLLIKGGVALTLIIGGSFAIDKITNSRTDQLKAEAAATKADTKEMVRRNRQMRKNCRAKCGSIWTVGIFGLRRRQKCMKECIQVLV